MDREDLTTHPELIYNVDETGFNTEHIPQKVVASSDKSQPVPVAVSSRGSTTTVIYCVNAIGQALPPYIVFKGKKKFPELLDNSLPGSQMIMSDSGWSNGIIFLEFLKTHFLRFVTHATGKKVQIGRASCRERV
jgi:hypothetical protein